MTDDVRLAYAHGFSRDFYRWPAEQTLPKAGLVRTATVCEFFAARRLEADRLVRRFRSRRPRFYYWSPKLGKAATARVSFRAETVTGLLYVYVTAEHLRLTPETSAKIEAAACEAAGAGAAFELWTEPDLFGPDPAYMASVARLLMPAR